MAEQVGINEIPQEILNLANVTSLPQLEETLRGIKEITQEEFRYVAKIASFFGLLLERAKKDKGKRESPEVTQRREDKIKNLGADLIKSIGNEAIKLNDPEKIKGFLEDYVCLISVFASGIAVCEENYPPNFIGCYATEVLLGQQPSEGLLHANIGKHHKTTEQEKVENKNRYILFQNSTMKYTNILFDGIVGEIISFYYLQALGLKPELATVSQDVRQKTDMFATLQDGKKIPVQVKASLWVPKTKPSTGQPERDLLIGEGLKGYKPKVSLRFEQGMLILEVETPSFFDPQGRIKLQETLADLIAKKSKPKMDLMKMQILELSRRSAV